MKLRFQCGEVYATPYGIARVIKMHGQCAEFSLMSVNDKAASMGWEKAMTFLCHPDDQTAPPPCESYALIPKVN